MAETAGSFSRIAFDAALPFDASSYWLEFISEGIAIEQPTLGQEGIRGTRMRDSSRNVRGGIRVGGPVTLSCTRKVLDSLLPPSLGAAEASNVFAVAEALPDIYCLIDKGHDIYLLSEGRVGKLTIAGEQNQTVKVTVETEFESYTVGQTWPGTLTQPDQTKPYFFADAGKVSLLSVDREVFAFEIGVDNVLSADQWGTSLTRDELLIATDRIVTVNLTVSGDSSNADLLTHTLDGQLMTLVLTSANEAGSILTITLGRVHFPRAVPLIGGKGPSRIQLQGFSTGFQHPGTGGHVPDISIENAHV